MTNVAVFDRFYGSTTFEALDAITPALDPDVHRVVSQAYTTRDAALGIVAIKEGRIDMPDVMIIGGRLEDDRPYTLDPATMSSVVDVPGRTILGKPKLRSKRVETTLLPVPLDPNSMATAVLPATHNSPVHPKEVSNFVGWMDTHLGGSGRAAYILSHLTRLLLPPEIVIIGVSSYNSMENLPINGVVERNAVASTMLSSMLARLTEA